MSAPQAAAEGTELKVISISEETHAQGTRAGREQQVNYSEEKAVQTVPSK
jgi:hypothetical protein